MTSAEFKAWRAQMGLSQQACAAALGITRVMVQNYERGSTAGTKPQPIAVPRTVALACLALQAGLDEQ